MDYLFVAKKVLTHLVYPVPVLILIFLTGLVFLWVSKRKVVGHLLLSLGLLCLIVFGAGWISSPLLSRLERSFPELDVEKAQKSNGQWIVVLGGGSLNNPGYPTTSQLSDTSLCRVIEGIRLHYRLPGTKLVFSGGPVESLPAEAELMGRMALELGVNPADILLEDRARTTEENAGRIRELLGQDSFVLVTNAWHMPRAMLNFKTQGLSPIPAPACHRCQTGEERPIWSGFPSAGGLKSLETVVHEYLGIGVILAKTEISRGWASLTKS